jgi:thioredoxin 1
MSGNGVLTLTGDRFKTEILESSSLGLVDFWAPWCGPCHLLAPTVQKIADRFSGQLKVGKLDIDEHPEVAGNYGITAIPTLLLFRDGKVVDRMVGVVSESALATRVEKWLEEPRAAGAEG